MGIYFGGDSTTREKNKRCHKYTQNYGVSQRDERQMKSSSARNVLQRRVWLLGSRIPPGPDAQNRWGCWEWSVEASPRSNSHPSIFCQGNKPQMGKVGFCSGRKDSASGGWCYHGGSDIQVSSYVLVHTLQQMFYASTTTSGDRLLSAVQRESQIQT